MGELTLIVVGLSLSFFTYLAGIRHGTIIEGDRAMRQAEIDADAHCAPSNES